MFVENGYDKKQLKNIIKRKKSQRTIGRTSSFDTNNLVSLPWIPGISPKIKKVYKKAGYKAVFKSGNNLNKILTSKNKPRTNANNNPGVYKLNCSCGKSYIGETKLKISSRIAQHQKSTLQGNWEKSAVSEHSKTCHGQFNWNHKSNTIKIEPNNFNRKCREALEMQFHKCTPSDGGLNLDDGQYVTTKFWKPLFQYMRNKKT